MANPSAFRFVSLDAYENGRAQQVFERAEDNQAK
jgi:hypothetical protein